MKEAAKAAHLRYVSDRRPGIRRVRTPRGFRYVGPDGNRITDEETISRIQKLAIPPAYEQVWICPDLNGHLQAVGRDARGRKQYRYHTRWREVRDDSKYAKMLLFGQVLPRIRERVEQDLALRGLPRERVMAAMVRLLETTLMRVGNEEYAKANRSYGLTTLRNRHVKVAGGKIHFDFRGKHGREHHIDLNDRRLARIVRRLQDLPGQELFHYVDGEGTPHPISSEDVNEYLREITGEDITAKDFRTWAATNLAAIALRELESYDTQAKAKKNVVQAVEAVAKMLGNTPAICRKCYIHPAIFDGYLDGSLLETLHRRAEEKLADPRHDLTAEEAAIMAFLSRRLSERAALGAPS
jgi:DNA topoisomerase-1